MDNSVAFDEENTNNIIATINKMFGQQEMLIRRKSEIINEIGEANAYLEHQEEVGIILHELQARAQAKTKFIYEELLTTLIHEVKGYDTENHKVTLKTQIKNNRPWLDVEVENADGQPRDVYLDKGGSIKSIVSLGLRFITLSRTSNRRVIFFDEPDKEINAKYADGIAKILHQLTKKIGMQVVYISHHDSSYFEGYARIIELSRVDGTIVTEVISDIDEQKYEGIDEDISDDLDGIGIRYVRLKNLKQHQNTLLELSPYVTVLTGDNDIGKSSIMHAVDAINKNKGRDGLIRDNESSCMVEIGLEDNANLTWTYKRSGSKRTKYLLKDSENKEIQSSDSGTAAPEWLPLYLGMGLYKDFDLNMSDQNNTSFILDARVSGHKRSEILSLGKETNQASAMIKEYNLRIDTFKKSKHHLKKELNSVKNKLECYRHLYSAEEKIASINSSKNKAIEASNCIGDISKSIDKLFYLTSKSMILQKVMPSEKLFVEQIIDENENKVISRIDYLTRKKTILEDLAKLNHLDEAKLEDLSGIKVMGIKISKLRKLSEIFMPLNNAIITEQVSSSSLDSDKGSIEKLVVLCNKANALQNVPTQMIGFCQDKVEDGIIPLALRIKGFNSKLSDLYNEENGLVHEISVIKNEKSEIVGSIDGDCPICGNHLEKGVVAHEHQY
ncbi:AAA family ATPase [Psychromonas sp. SP041]|uniref:AAA family ATPase n=1 Tax=Psychromonas sp. SP041 TaxID=1365007 RepID=UPI0010C7B8A0|nr:AAA family ATPase [Psychromonas sp. SP041]